MNNNIDPGFIHDLSSLDRLRAGVDTDKDGSLRSAATQFEAIFTNMLFKSMRDANSVFESDLTSGRHTQFYEQMHDEQMASELSSTGSLGLADLIVEQLSAAEEMERPESQGEPVPLEQTAEAMPLNIQSPAVPFERKELPVSDTDHEMAVRAAMQRVVEGRSPSVEEPSRPFNSPEEFVTRMQPYAERAARSLGTDPAVLIAQAALETGWGKKVITNARGSSHNLFNIKAQPSWQGDKMATQTLEYYDGVAVQERAAFRSYDDFQSSFDDYVHFLKTNPRYGDALTQSSQPEQFIRGLHKAGYATDPKYSEKVISVMNRVNGILSN
ncbi:flagellar assembly peptidoglycan hydrolase FlgJ [Thaumasiovibrio subtropicus]|uniref:flagellar assembly peptidoglycan hydrolase FlgJ n=1 Tax=Thaumasiovibrio subtropicus TaxID=1891207 RepID=UPI000B34E511|nr:flagellar assembly peptidoglycan hydrolase FlgJ [Thaumasiovibrio subtropicus]